MLKVPMASASKEQILLRLGKMKISVQLMWFGVKKTRLLPSIMLFEYLKFQACHKQGA